jgi:hypothetical protein
LLVAYYEGRPRDGGSPGAVTATNSKEESKGVEPGTQGAARRASAPDRGGADDPNVLNSDGRTSWRAPRVRMAIDNRAEDGPALVKYIKDLLRKSESEGWNALLEAGRLDLSFEDMVANTTDPLIAGLFSDEDRELATRLLGQQNAVIQERRTAAEDEALARDRRLTAMVREKALSKGEEWTPEREAMVMASLKARRAG